MAAVNAVRGRTGVNMPALSDILSSDEFLKRVKHERRVELAFEGHRFWDLRRWKIGPESVTIKRVTVTKDGNGNLFDYTSTSDRIWDDKMYFYPIPQSEIYKNRNLIQNPGWE